MGEKRQLPFLFVSPFYNYPILYDLCRLLYYPIQVSHVTLAYLFKCMYRHRFIILRDEQLGL